MKDREELRQEIAVFRYQLISGVVNRATPLKPGEIASYFKEVSATEWTFPDGCGRLISNTLCICHNLMAGNARSNSVQFWMIIQYILYMPNSIMMRKCPAWKTALKRRLRSMGSVSNFTAITALTAYWAALKLNDKE